MGVKAALRHLKKNLNALRERAAKFGRNVSPELINQIEDHEQAMALTEQATQVVTLCGPGDGDYGEILAVVTKQWLLHLTAPRKYGTLEQIW